MPCAKKLLLAGTAACSKAPAVAHLCNCVAQRALHALRTAWVRQQHPAAVAHYLRLVWAVSCKEIHRACTESQVVSAGRTEVLYLRDKLQWWQEHCAVKDAATVALIRMLAQSSQQHCYKIKIQEGPRLSPVWGACVMCPQREHLT
jgi:hypothetical protein